MMNWFCCSHQHSRKIYPQYSYNWYVSNEHPHELNEKYDEKLTRCDATKNPFEHQKYSRIKIKSKDLQDIYATLRSTKQNFIDDEFQRVQANIAKDLYHDGEIQWKRVSDIVPKAVYSLQNKSQQQLNSTFKSNNKALQTCLILISRTHPRKLQRIRNHKTSRQGIYQFKLFKNGMIHNVIIDDYVPSYKGFHIFTGPANDVQVYPMLLEKAIAKLCGGYSQIHKNPLEIMEMIYCGAIRRQNLDDLRNLQQFRELVTKTLLKQGLTSLIAKKDKKIKQYGINDSQIYHIISSHQIKLKNNQEHTLYQILSQNKMSAWNGAYRLNDPIWKQVDVENKQKIFKQIQKNHSFTVVDKQIYRIFQGLIVYEDTQTMNKDWLESYTESGYPSFCRFKLKNKDNVFLRITTKQKIRQSIILAKVIQGDSYQLIGGNFDENAEFLQCHYQIQPGDYVICVMQNWILKKQGQYVVYLSSTCRTVLVQQIKPIQGFLQKLLTQHSLRKNQQLNSIFYQCLREIGLGYLIVFIKPPSQIKKIKVNFKKIMDQDWQVLEPFNDMSQIVTTSNVLIIMKMLKNKPRELTNFPIQAFIVSGQ